MKKDKGKTKIEGDSSNRIFSSMKSRFHFHKNSKDKPKIYKESDKKEKSITKSDKENFQLLQEKWWFENYDFVDYLSCFQSIQKEFIKKQIIPDLLSIHVSPRKYCSITYKMAYFRCFLIKYQVRYLIQNILLENIDTFKARKYELVFDTALSQVINYNPHLGQCSNLLENATVAPIAAAIIRKYDIDINQYRIKKLSQNLCYYFQKKSYGHFINLCEYARSYNYLPAVSMAFSNLIIPTLLDEKSQRSVNTQLYFFLVDNKDMIKDALFTNSEFKANIALLLSGSALATILNHGRNTNKTHLPGVTRSSKEIIKHFQIDDDVIIKILTPLWKFSIEKQIVKAFTDDVKRMDKSLQTKVYAEIINNESLLQNDPPNEENSLQH